MVEEWLQAIIHDFGKHLGLSRFALNEKGVAGVSFENGATFRLEYRGDRLFLCMATRFQPTEYALKALLQLSHPAAANRQSLNLHAAYLPTSQRGMLMATIPNRSLTVPLLDKTFSALWTNIQKL